MPAPQSMPCGCPGWAWRNLWRRQCRHRVECPAEPHKFACVRSLNLICPLFLVLSSPILSSLATTGQSTLIWSIFFLIFSSGPDRAHPLIVRARCACVCLGCSCVPVPARPRHEQALSKSAGKQRAGGHDAIWGLRELRRSSQHEYSIRRQLVASLLRVGAARSVCHFRSQCRRLLPQPV